jgi:8-oxo-dGTP pyrophosphatase MutT (NUDIX family)
MSTVLLTQIEQVLLSQHQAEQSPEHNRKELAEFLALAPKQFCPASVLFGLVARQDGLHVLLTKRTEHMRHHAGQISFPGGRIEVSDNNPAHAALREAHEEIGLNSGSVTVLGYLEPILTITGFRVYPVVALINADYHAQADGVEVAEIFEAPLDLFLDQGNEQSLEIMLHGKTRHLVEFHWQHFRIWGATATMLINLRQRLEQNV